MNVVDSSGWLEYFADADSVILATARLRGATVWTQDADFKGIEDVRYVAKSRD